MIIDSHTHVDKFGWYDPPETIVRLMDEAGIDKSIIMTYGDAPDVEGSIEYIAEAVEKYPERLIGYARMNPSRGEEAHQLFEKAMELYGFKGLKLHPVGNLCHPAGPETVEIIHLATRYRAPVLFHCGDEELTLPLQIAQAAEACPDATIILGHAGGYFHWKDAIRAAESHPNIVLDTSALPYPQAIKEAVQRIGASRVLYASDGPGCDPRIEVHKVKMAGLIAQDEEGVFHKSIQAILDRVTTGGH
ncbi:MAG: amidohydrolase family protein [Anaerolineae bacterium]|nr:amidohydrolase family protein [Anaerolineae bacterium]NIN99547.1 amidohydrolase family protein [Anaerolineae bacterium]NIQ82407.1 amidohydrolase family protein [Anaerolineae bacterium]